ncbi:MAG: ChrB protein [Candidatus Methylomirabilota bacterium]|nr:chromate resistance protein [candidate division NC10 bacterium]PWB42986.1 MAG: ChrB protein [candidate division NC10 bacterium]
MAQEARYKWLVLIYTLPPGAGSSRVRIWRKLKKLGAVSFRNAVYLLPFGEERYEIAQWLCQEIQRAQGEATLLKVEQIENLADNEVAELFRRARNEDYAELLKGGEAWLECLHALPRESVTPEAVALADELKVLEKQLAELQEIDYFRAPTRQEVEGLLRRCHAMLRDLLGGRKGAPTRTSTTLRAEAFRGKTWVTRPRPHVDRMASAWLIRRFIDPQATFAFATKPDTIKGAIPFDYPKVEFGHQGEDCTFETLLTRFGLEDSALQALAEIVHDADLKDAKFGRDETKGIEAVLKGLAPTIPDDQALLAEGLRLFDAIYASFGGHARPHRTDPTNKQVQK